MGTSTKLPRSLLYQILIWSFFALLLLMVFAGGFSFWSSYRESSDFQKDNLKNIANLIANNGDDDASTLTSNANNQHYQTDDSDGLLRIDIWRIDDNHFISAKDSNTEIIPWEQVKLIPKGMSKQTIGDKIWQVYRLDESNKIILVRQNSDFQDEMARSNALQSILSLLIAMVIFFTILTAIMWRAFRPLKTLSAQVGERETHDLRPVAVEGLPNEILPFVIAINQLLVKVKENVDKQQRFIADASHELRSPLTAISLQLQHLQRLTPDDKVKSGLDKLALRVKRNQDLVEQLLTLAKLNANQDHSTEVSVPTSIEQAINLLLPIIDHKAIDLTLDISPEYKQLAVKMDNTALLLLIKNILQNAVLYTPEQGRVSIILTNISNTPQKILETSIAIIGQQGIKLNELLGNTPIIQIIDTGPGISPHHYQQAFEPFVRLSQQTDEIIISKNRSDSITAVTTENPTEVAKGTGLGLAMVRTICEQADISLFLAPSSDTVYNLSPNQGLCVTLVF